MKIRELIENASAGATASGAVATAPAGVAYGAGTTYGVGTQKKKKKSKKGVYANEASPMEDVSSLILRR